MKKCIFLLFLVSLSFHSFSQDDTNTSQLKSDVGFFKEPDLFIIDSFEFKGNKEVYLNKLKSKKILSLQHLIREETGQKFIYSQQDTNNALKDSYNPFLSRRTYAKLDYIKILFKEKFFLNTIN